MPRERAASSARSFDRDAMARTCVSADAASGARSRSR